MQALERVSATGSQILLTKSHRLYSLAQQLIVKRYQEDNEQNTKNEEEKMSDVPELFNIVHLLAAANNLAQVCKHLGRDDVANKHFQQLLSSVLYLLHSKADKVDEGSNLRPFIEAFFHSTSHLVLKNYAADAA
jgi:hypothetical protein